MSSRSEDVHHMVDESSAHVHPKRRSMSRRLRQRERSKAKRLQFDGIQPTSSGSYEKHPSVYRYLVYIKFMRFTNASKSILELNKFQLSSAYPELSRTRLAHFGFDHFDSIPFAEFPPHPSGKWLVQASLRLPYLPPVQRRSTSGLIEQGGGVKVEHQSFGAKVIDTRYAQRHKNIIEVEGENMSEPRFRRNVSKACFFSNPRLPCTIVTPSPQGQPIHLCSLSSKPTGAHDCISSLCIMIHFGHSEYCEIPFQS
ncbi:unnamed protein product [Protopolystoma xenopodis]|uniref:Uncharacterized protein n=1 Tax=Protopolystoma xenopodis TaxID=117903 RepID=A0A448XDK7_9PLAT|nr:unnamed protein product [Protopolystoma xenopodis]